VSAKDHVLFHFYLNSFHKIVEIKMLTGYLLLPNFSLPFGQDN